MEPVHDSVVTGGVVVVLARLPDGRLVDCCKNHDSPDIGGIEGRALDPWQRELTDDFFR